MRKSLLALLFLAFGAIGVHAGVWDTTTPSGTDPINQGDDRIREMKLAIEEALEWSGVFPGTNPLTSPKYQWTLDQGLQANRPTGNLASGQLYLSTDTGTIDRYNGSSWTPISTYFAPGTKMLFYQSGCPAGWTGVGAVTNDMFVRSVTTNTTGGSTGGTMAASTDMLHSHADGTYATSTNADAAHTSPVTAELGIVGHARTDGSGWSGGTATISSQQTSEVTASASSTHTEFLRTIPGAGHSHDVVGASASVFTGAFLRVDVIICSKD